MTAIALLLIVPLIWADQCPRALTPLEPMYFHFVPPGKFRTRIIDDQTGELSELIEREVKEPFEMSATLITQAQWNEVLSLPAHGLPDFPAKGHPIREVRAWIARLNELSRQDDPRIYHVIENHRAHATYRLPSEDEWMRVAEEGVRDFRCRKERGASLLSVAWLLENSRGFVRRVATLDPLWVNEKPFYDLIGLVEEYMREFWRDDLRQPPETISIFERDWAVARGGSTQFESRFFDFLYVRRLYRETFIGRRTKFESHVGARLVRELPKREPFLGTPFLFQSTAR